MSEILTRLRGYNPPDRTIDIDRRIAVDIWDAVDEIERLRLALETATREAEEERRTAEATLKFLGRIAEVTWEAGLPSGDREQTLKNVRALASRPAPPADAARQADRQIPAKVPLATAILDARAALRDDRHVSIASSHGRMLVAMGNLLDALSSPRPRAVGEGDEVMSGNVVKGCPFCGKAPALSADRDAATCHDHVGWLMLSEWNRRDGIGSAYTFDLPESTSSSAPAMRKCEVRG